MAFHAFYSNLYVLLQCQEMSWFSILQFFFLLTLCHTHDQVIFFYHVVLTSSLHQLSSGRLAEPQKYEIVVASW